MTTDTSRFVKGYHSRFARSRPRTALDAHVNPLLVASHRNTIARPRALLCAPATLESTSLVAAVGLDLYLTRVAPAREFDRLNEDFNYVALLGSIVVLVVASWGTQWMIKRRELNRAWK